MKRVTKEEEDIYINEYLSGSKIKDICAKHNRSYPTISALLAKRGIPKRSARIDLEGKIFHYLTVVKFSHYNDWRSSIWTCQCICGNVVKVNSNELQRGKAKSCGCWNSEQNRTKKFHDLSGRRFGSVTVLRHCGYGENRKGLHSQWECLCDCGKISILIQPQLINRNRSCGCLRFPSGENHPRYNHSLSYEDRLGRRALPEYLHWRASVYKRDDYKCVLSNSKTSICAHHLDGWHWCKERRFDLSNGVTLSEPIHILFHTMYGFGYNTEAQFTEFKERYLNGEFSGL